ncbi:hypothetical protein MKX03_012875 [Papaver bracteatum]|nr:hypothetical protein MKX03_012875 [Papaver bracteatum]
MVFAFGESGLVEGVRGGGRSTWETACLVALERIELQSDTSSTPGRAGGVGDTSSPVQPTLASEPVSSLRDGHQLPTTSVTHIAGVPSSFVPNVSAGSKFVLSTTWSTPPRPNFHVSAGHVNTEQPNGIALSDETCRQIDQAQRQAEEASFLAAAAVKYSQSVWTQLAIQKSSGFVADKEANLASAAVTIAAAAAAGARIASDAALRAKLMADEVLVLPGKLGKSMSDECLPGGVKSMVNFTTNYSDSILVAAREVSKKRVQAASAATRRAENWDAVVKAAVMAAEAVSQASTITAMGEPIPFTLQELAEAGPEDYWKIHQHDQIAKPDSYATSMAEQLEAVCAEEGVTRHIERNLEETEGTSDQGKKVLPPNELSEQVESSNLPVNGMRWGPAGNSEKGLVEPKPEGNRAAHESARISTENQIEEGSVPEVLSCKEGLGWLVWLPAKVLNLKDGKAHVCCTELARCEGPDQREYVLLDGEGGQALRILIPHLVSGLKYEGTRKRQRSAVGDCSWSAGDKVDAHINNG